jgi:uncharacterized protein with FMN-binding domain
MPKRGALALLLTTLALALLLSFKTPAEVPLVEDAAAVAGAASPAPTVAATPVADLPAAATPAPATTDPVTPAAETPTATPTATSSPTAAYRDGTVAGPAVEIRWGVVQVQVTISDGVITDVTALQLPTGDHHSCEISERAAPVLRSAALAAQSAEIDVLSGATYTSLAYARSLQAALDSARA